jgi:hypothetical protein
VKILKFLLVSIFTLLVFAVGVWLFAPWESGGLYVFDKVRLAAAENGWYLSYSGFESSGTIFPVYSIRSLDVESSFFRTSLSNVRVKVLPLSSFLSGAPTCYVEFGGGGASVCAMNNVLNDIFSHSGGTLRLSASGRRLRVSGAYIGGDLQVTGDLDYDRLERRLSTNTIRIKVPESVDAMMNSVGAQYVGRYIESTGPGEWRIKENAIAN